MDLTHSDVQKIVEILNSADQLEEVELVFAGLRLHVRKGRSAAAAAPFAAAPIAAPVTAPVRIAAPAAAVPAPAPADGASAALAPGQVGVYSPMLGTFYHAPSPGEKPFVEVGQRVKADDNVGVIEVMKLFNTIRAGVAGTVVRIEAGNACLVEFNQVLIVIDTNGG
ncbi:acetyl-CoA carboxylase biotin carboxyl carrier protein [Lacisediminimonas sp.]|uniref:acetyl-CoA carboxylase biotin carboxyl carrier protein n=1 Tax=Lacisediminimonas sp. TaxID=3060582 RepID=UPI00271B717A|nr:acetyl-CoA carboxylase biotin carboxyl carrier protein [Lacisediminimonas sp.]MDO8298721.1 acetyl-CoA carboxylase biotin carboxyl carrier protein [Lacisediminimonas sp.]MDO9215857.1 acetyl-CoA carboxylase biotin carboxyl carrier protein [Lacisediminimonas sp.]